MYESFVLANLLMAIIIDVGMVGGTILCIIDYFHKKKVKRNDSI